MKTNLPKHEQDELDRARRQYVETTPSVLIKNGDKKKISVVIGVDYTHGKLGRGVYLTLRGGTVVHESQVVAEQQPPEEIPVKEGQVYFSTVFDPERKVFVHFIKTANGKLSVEMRPEQFSRMVEYHDEKWADYVNTINQNKLKK